MKARKSKTNGGQVNMLKIVCDFCGYTCNDAEILDLNCPVCGQYAWQEVDE